MRRSFWSLLAFTSLVTTAVQAQVAIPAIEIREGQCTMATIGGAIAPRDIGEPVSGVAFDKLSWFPASGPRPATCLMEGRILPVDTGITARPIKFAVAMPALWNQRTIHTGGGGLNGVVPQLVPDPQRTPPPGAPSPSSQPGVGSGFVMYGSDSGHTLDEQQWALNDEAIRNFGYAQLKKTHDVAQILVRRFYGTAPRYRYFVGNSQGGREGLTSVQRHPKDYHGVVATVPVLGLNSLMQAPAAIRRRENAMADQVPQRKGRMIAAEFMRQCDALDGADDAVINDYMGCRAIFNVNDGQGTREPWASRRCPNGRDPRPDDATEGACLTDGQIGTLNYILSRQAFDATRAFGTTHFGMWAPSTEFAAGGLPAASGNALLNDIRYAGQEGAAADARVFSSLGSLGVTGYLLKDLTANPLTYPTLPSHQDRQRLLSEWFDATDPDLRAFQRAGGKLIVAIGTNDTLAAPGAQLDYYAALVDRMGRREVDRFARLYVLPQRGHGLQGSSYTVTGSGKAVNANPLPSQFDRFALLQRWVEQDQAPAKTQTVTGPNAAWGLMCSYPEHAHYLDGRGSQPSAWECR